MTTLVQTEALSGSLSETLRFTIRYSVNIALRRISCHSRNYSQPYFFKRNQSSDNRSHGFGPKFLLKKLSASNFQLWEEIRLKDRSDRIGFWNGPNQVWILLSEQKSQRNFVLVNDLFKSKGNVAICMTDRASVHTGNASEQFLHHNRILIPVHTVPEQLLKRNKNLSGTVWT